MQRYPGAPDDGMQGSPGAEFEPTPFQRAFESCFYWTMVGSGYALTALRWGWVPLCVVLGGSSVYCRPSVDVAGWFRPFAPPPPPPPSS